MLGGACTQQQQQQQQQQPLGSVLARRVVFAAPPRLLSQRVTFSPPLSPRRRAAMDASRTWMAGVTKVALVYPKRFWPLGQLSNSGLPQRGLSQPAFQVYDGSVSDKEPALTFFTLARGNDAADDARLASMCADQLAQLYAAMGRADLAAQLASFEKFAIKRWPLDPGISDDPAPDTIHPHPHPVPALSAPDWDGLLLFAGTESDRQSPGVMEGAVGAGRRVLAELGAEA